MNTIKEQREGICNDMLQAAKVFLPVKAEQGEEEYRKLVIPAMKDYSETLKNQKEYVTFCHAKNLDADEFMDEILNMAIKAIE